MNSLFLLCTSRYDVFIGELNRRSTMEFVSQQSRNKTLTQNAKAVRNVKPVTIVCTRLHQIDVEVFARIVKKLGGFVVENEVTDNTTHLVMGENKRTINVLRALARGLWLMKYEWVSQIFLYSFIIYCLES